MGIVEARNLYLTMLGKTSYSIEGLQVKNRNRARLLRGFSDIGRAIHTYLQAKKKK